MSYGEMTVGDIRKAIEGMPDDSPVLVKPHDERDFASHERRRVRDFEGNVTIVEAVPAKVWNYNTRVVHNMYQANDDRFDQNQILLIEIGGDAP